MDVLHALAGLLVGFLVGLTGVGGGSLMAPLLILVFGTAPATAVGTDLWFAFLTKTVGSFVHHKHGSPDWAVVKRLALGSVPAAILTLVLLWTFGQGQVKSDLLLKFLGCVLFATALVMLAKGRLEPYLARVHGSDGSRITRRQLWLTLVSGLTLGVLVTLTSIGAGALGAVMLALIFPLRLDAKSIVGTDIVHAVPLTLVAAFGHSLLGNVSLLLLGNLLIGSIPGIVAGSLVAGRVNEGFVRVALALMLVISAIKMVFG